MTFQGKYCSLNTVPVRWQAGVFSLLIQNKDNFKLPLGSDIRADYFQQLMFCDFFFSLFEDAVVSFAAMRHCDASSDCDTSMKLGNIKKWKELTCLLTAERHRRQGAMSFALRNFIRGAGKCPVIVYIWPNQVDILGLLKNFDFKPVFTLDDGRVCYLRRYSSKI